jgi:hypothetical protein
VTDLARLVVKLTANVAEYEQKLDKANRKLDGFKKKTDQQLGGIQKSFANFNRSLGALGVGFSFVAITRGLAQSALAAIEYGDEIGKAAAKTGVGAEAFSELAFAAKQSDVEMSSLSTAFKKLQVTISSAGSGTKAAQEAFAALGIEFESFRALAPDKQFELIAEQISKIQDPADKTRAAVELFGRSGADLLPLFEQGAAGIRMAREEAQRLGASLTEEQVAKLQEADDAIKRLSQTWDGLARTLTVAVAPGLSDVLAAMTNVLSQEPKVISFGQAWAGVADAFRKNGLGTTWTDALAEIRKGGTVAPLGSSARTSAMSRGDGGDGQTVLRDRPPGFKPPTPKGPAGESPAAKAARLELERMQKAYEDIATAGLAALQSLETPTEAINRQFEEQRHALETLAAAYPGYAEAAQEGIARAAVAAQDQLDALKQNNGELERSKELAAEGAAVYAETRTAVENWATEIERLTALYNAGAISQDTFNRAIEQSNEAYAKVGDTITDFERQANENLQGLLADILFDPFSEGLDGMLNEWGAFLRRAAAEALAAKIMESAFGTGGIGSGGGSLGGLLDKGIGMLGGLFGGGGSMSGGVGLSQDMLDGAFRSLDGFADGGTLRAGQWGIVGERGPELAYGGRTGMTIQPTESTGGSVTVQNHFAIQAPNGTISRATELQIAAAAARGAARANQRNN